MSTPSDQLFEPQVGKKDTIPNEVALGSTKTNVALLKMFKGQYNQKEFKIGNLLHDFFYQDCLRKKCCSDRSQSMFVKHIFLLKAN